MDLTFDGRRLHLPFELISHICSFLENASDACAVRLTNRVFCAAATPLMTDVWDSPSLLFVKPSFSSTTQAYDESGIDPDNRPVRVEKPVTVWTWLNVPTHVTLEDEKTAEGERLAGLLNAPDKSSSDYSHRSFHQYGRKAVCWGRMQERPELFCIITQWDCQHSWTLYRNSEEAEALRRFLEEVAPECIPSSTSEYAPIEARRKRQDPLFSGLYEIRTIYFRPNMTEQQRRVFEKTRHLYRSPHMVVYRQYDHLGFTPWWWLPGLRTFQGTTAVSARFAFYWRNAELEKTLKDTETRRGGTDLIDGPPRRVVEIFEEELQAAGVLGSMSLHCEFSSGSWRN